MATEGQLKMANNQLYTVSSHIWPIKSNPHLAMAARRNNTLKQVKACLLNDFRAIQVGQK